MNEMTSPERRDMPWIFAAFAVVIVVIVGAMLFRLQ
jgi:uncharacterized membrane-anchored protein YhcB (DUF1043 family)